MSTIAGYVGWKADLAPAHACSLMAAALGPYGGNSFEIRNCGKAAFVRSLKLLLPEDEFDRQPLLLAGGRTMLAADVRIDNREEIERRLGWSAKRSSRSSDSDLLAAAWEQWGEESLDHLLGDIALAVWNDEDRSLSLARSALSLKPLFYYESPNFWAFGSMPAALHAIPQIPKEIDFDHAASIAALHSYLSPSTIFAGVHRVKPGHVVRLAPSGSRVRRFWRPTRAIDRNLRPQEYVEKFRGELDRAVRAQLRRHHGVVASQLSAGRDSSAVTSTAARILANSGESLVAVTGAPPSSFRGAAVEDRLMDESELASLTAAMHPNIHHLVRRPDRPAALDRITASHRLNHGPLLNPTQLVWWEDMHGAAVEQGASILLSAGSGNFGISAGGPNQLRDVLVEDGFGRWILAAARIGGLSWSSWRNIASMSYGPSLPEWLYRAILRASGRTSQLDLSVPILRPPYRQAIEASLCEALGDSRPLRSYSDYRLEMLLRRDNAELLTLATSGLDARDPTSDRRLIEFCLSLPNDMLISGRAARPLYEMAMSDRIPPAVLANRRRGYQTAEWFEHYNPAEVRKAFRRYSDNHIVRELIDLSYVDRLIDSWPASGWENRAQIYTYRNSLIGTLALADFISIHFS